MKKRMVLGILVLSMLLSSVWNPIFAASGSEYNVYSEITGLEGRFRFNESLLRQMEEELESNPNYIDTYRYKEDWKYAYKKIYDDYKDGRTLDNQVSVYIYKLEVAADALSEAGNVASSVWKWKIYRETKFEEYLVDAIQAFATLGSFYLGDSEGAIANLEACADILDRGEALASVEKEYIGTLLLLEEADDDDYVDRAASIKSQTREYYNRVMELPEYTYGR